MTRIDDSALLMHRSDYDPAKAREYYLRTRELTGRKKSSPKPTDHVSRKEFKKAATGNEGTYARPNNSNEARREELKAQREALEKRLDRLREVLRELVDAAKTRSGVKEAPAKANSKTETATAASKSKKGSKTEKSEPLTSTQKKEKAKTAREEYQKEKGPTLNQDVEELQRQVQDIRAKIESKLEDARNNSKKPKKSA